MYQHVTLIFGAKLMAMAIAMKNHEKHHVFGTFCMCKKYGLAKMPTLTGKHFQEILYFV